MATELAGRFPLEFRGIRGIWREDSPVCWPDRGMEITRDNDGRRTKIRQAPKVERFPL